MVESDLLTLKMVLESSGMRDGEQRGGGAID
jgi:hypothetical protein